MGRISTGIGLISGINSGSIIDQLMQIESQPVQLLQTRINNANQQKLAFTDLLTRLTALNVNATALTKPSTFNNATVNSTNSDVLSATAAPSAQPGSYQFQVARTVTTQQLITGGFADATTVPVGASKYTVSAGDGALHQSRLLSNLNGGKGVTSGTFTITDKTGKSATFTTVGARTLDDVANAINTNTTIGVQAIITDQGLVIKDESGGNGNLVIADGDAIQKTATSLGIKGSTSGTTITGSAINTIGTSTRLQTINDGRGIRTASGNDIRITYADNSTTDVDLSSATTLGDVVNDINTAAGGKLTASLDPTTNALVLTDNTNGGSFTVASINGSNTAEDLGIAGTGGATLTGSAVVAGLTTVLVSSLNGGNGLSLGAFTIADKKGDPAETIDLSGAKTVEDIINAINNGALKNVVSASLNAAGNGIQITDSSLKSGTTTIADTGGGTIAAQLGIAGTFASTITSAITGSNLGLAKVTAGTLTIEAGDGQLSTVTNLADLNGGTGVRRGVFRITDRAGHSDQIDISDAVTLDDVVNKINTSLDISVHASISGNGLVLSDQSGGSGNLSVQDLSSGHAAADLGIAGTVSNTNTLTGTAINKLGAATTLNSLNDGRGVRTAANAAPDFRVTLSDGSTVDVNLSKAKTVGDVLAAINNAGNTHLTASLNGNGLKLTDTSGGAGSLSVSALNNSKAAQDIGLTQTASGNTITGSSILAGLDTVLVSSLRGGTGLNLGSFTIQDRSGASASVDLSGAVTVQDILDKINQAGIGISASLNASGNGIQLTDTTGGSGNVVVSNNVGSTIATQLGLAGSYDTTSNIVSGANLQRQYINENSLLSNYVGGKAVSPGVFKITNSSGASANINISNAKTLGDVINAINAATSGNQPLNVTASINANGDGLLLTDNAGGASKLTVADVSGTAAANLQIAGTATANTINGSFEKTIDLSIDDTLTTVQSKINNLNFGVRATIINDGSAATPYRLSLTATNSGAAGKVVFDAGRSQLGTQTLVDGQDAAVFVGSSNTATPLLVTTSQNQLTGIVPGLTISINGASSTPVTLNVTRTPDQAISNVQSFVQAYNDMTTKIAQLTNFDASDPTQNGILLGDPTVQEIQFGLSSALEGAVSNVGQYHVLSDIGLTFNQDGTLNFDSSVFQTAYATDPDSVSKLFTALQTTTTGTTTTTNKVGLAYSIQTALNNLIDPTNGVVTLENQSIDTQNQQFQDRISELNDLIDQKRTRLETQFANMESVLANLQSQSSALASLSGIKPASSSSSSSSSSG